MLSVKDCCAHPSLTLHLEQLLPRNDISATSENYQERCAEACLLLQVEIVEQFLETDLNQRMPSFNMTEFQKQLMSVFNTSLFSVTDC